jgi:uncharacterized protein (TIGR02594 family)
MPNYRSLVPGGFYSSPDKKGQVPASIWSNNPGAINGDAAWVKAQPGFVTTVRIGGGNPIAVFETPEQGVATWYNLILRYRNAGVTTLQGVVNRYGGGQDYSQYVEFVVSKTGYAAAKQLDPDDLNVLLAIAKAMFWYEAGKATPLTDNQIIYGFQLGQGKKPRVDSPTKPSFGGILNLLWRLVQLLGWPWNKRPAPAPQSEPERPPEAPSGVPYWLQTMREITGTNEYPGGNDNPVILSWRDYISQRYPEMTGYLRAYNHDSIPWCGLTVAYCMAKNNIRPVYGSDDLHRFLWANAWASWGVKCEPKLGCVMVFTRNGGGHVALYEGEEGNHYIIRGGNQSDSVNVMRMPKSQFTGARWPA